MNKFVGKELRVHGKSSLGTPAVSAIEHRWCTATYPKAIYLQQKNAFLDSQLQLQLQLQPQVQLQPAALER